MINASLTRDQFVTKVTFIAFRCEDVNWIYGGADKSLALPGKKQTRKHVRYASDLNNIETRAFIKSPTPF